MILAAIPVGNPCKGIVVPHVTIAYLPSGVPSGMDEAVREWAARTGPFSATVDGELKIGNSRLYAWLLAAHELQGLRDLCRDWCESLFPTWVPHMTYSYKAGDEPTENRKRFHFRSVAILDSDEMVVKYPLGEQQTETITLDCNSRYEFYNKHHGPDGRFTTADAVGAVQSSLDDSLRRAPWKGSPNCYAGHCYVASEALYHVLGGRKAGLKPMHVKHEGSPHWYLESADGTIIDATAGQFSTPVPYKQGRGKGFLTKDPSKRAQIVIDRTMAQLAPTFTA